MNITNLRSSGILLHPSSFPSQFGIGDFGDSAYTFIDFLEKSGQKLWQVLPLGPTDYGDSPYQSFSSFAGQPLIISPTKLKDLGLLNNQDLTNFPHLSDYEVDYVSVYKYKGELYKKAYANFRVSTNKVLKREYDNFITNEKGWLDDYALFMSLLDYYNGDVWTEWDSEIAFPTKTSKAEWVEKLSDEINYYKFIQYIFFKQWFELKDYANSKNIKIIGDIPIFVSFNSADVWMNKHLFYLDDKGYPTFIAGVPPDYFSEAGQLWGNPLYNWDELKKNNYKWWINRISHSLRLVDILRIDHFRGFEAYWSIPYGSSDATKGTWEKGPDKDFFYALQKQLGKDLPIIAEDLGIITKNVEELRDTFNFPGMKVLQFGFENLEDNLYLPHNFVTNSVCYSGTHDNNTSLGWYQMASEASKDKLRRYMNTDANDVSWDFIRTCFGSVSNLAIVPLQDILSLDSHSRMNTPGTPTGNWRFRYTSDKLNDHIIYRLSQITNLYGR